VSKYKGTRGRWQRGAYEGQPRSYPDQLQPVGTSWDQLVTCDLFRQPLVPKWIVVLVRSYTEAPYASVCTAFLV
jgi:hypothetical protein